jgi:hypothetical protein
LESQLTKPKTERHSSPFDRVPSIPNREEKRGKSFMFVGISALAIGAVFAGNTWISIPEVEFGSGVENLPACTRNSVVDFDLQVFTTGTTIRALDVSGLGPDCNNQFFRVSLMSETESVIRTLPAVQLTTSTTRRLTVEAPSIDPALVFGINLELSDTAF